MNLIILTPEQADQVRGSSPCGQAALEPVQILNGDFILPGRVLNDPKHSQHHELLASLPQLDIGEVEFIPAEE